MWTDQGIRYDSIIINFNYNNKQNLQLPISASILVCLLTPRLKGQDINSSSVTSIQSSSFSKINFKLFISFLNHNSNRNYIEKKCECEFYLNTRIEYLIFTKRYGSGWVGLKKKRVFANATADLVTFGQEVGPTFARAHMRGSLPGGAPLYMSEPNILYYKGLVL